MRFNIRLDETEVNINITSAVEILHRGLVGSMPMFAAGAFFPLFFPFYKIFFALPNENQRTQNRSTFWRRGRPIAQKQAKAKGGKKVERRKDRNNSSRRRNGIEINPMRIAQMNVGRSLKLQ